MNIYHRETPPKTAQPKYILFGEIDDDSNKFNGFIRNYKNIKNVKSALRNFFDLVCIFE